MSYALNTPLNVGYFVLNKWAIGIRGNYGYSKDLTREYFRYYGVDKFTYSTTTISQQIALGLFSRFYFLPRSSKFNIYADIAYGYGRNLNTLESTYSPTIRTTTNLQILNASIAPVYFVNNRVALEFILSYANQLTKETKNYTTNTFLVGLGFQIHFNEPKVK